jgi:hypothetical protein
MQVAWDNRPIRPARDAANNDDFYAHGVSSHPEESVERV